MRRRENRNRGPGAVTKSDRRISVGLRVCAIAALAPEMSVARFLALLESALAQLLSTLLGTTAQKASIVFFCDTQH
jgi:hypothetical protein